MITHGKNIKVFTGNAHPKLAQEIATKLGLPLGDSTISKFSDGEISVTIRETVRGSDVFMVQTISPPINDHIMELLIMIDAFKRASAGRITAVIPYMGYARQDRKAKSRDPISAKLLADLITTAGADRVLTMDLHAPQIQGFFNIPVDHLAGVPSLVPYFQKKFEGQYENLVAVSPDVGSMGRCRNFAHRLGLPIAIVDKRRPSANVSEVMNIIGDVEGKTCIIVDDMVDTAGTLCNAAQALIDIGKAKEVYACATHAVLSGPAYDRIDASPIKELIFLDTIPESTPPRSKKLTYLPISPVFAEAIERIYEEVSMATLFG